MHTYSIEVTDTFAGEANYCWVRRYTVTTPELTHYGYDGATNYGKANRAYNRELVKRAKAAAGWTNSRCTVEHNGDTITIRPRGICQVMFINFCEA